METNENLCAIIINIFSFATNPLTAWMGDWVRGKTENPLNLWLKNWVLNRTQDPLDTWLKSWIFHRATKLV